MLEHAAQITSGQMFKYLSARPKQPSILTFAFAVAVAPLTLLCQHNNSLRHSVVDSCQLPVDSLPPVGCDAAAAAAPEHVVSVIVIPRSRRQAFQKSCRNRCRCSQGWMQRRLSNWQYKAPCPLLQVYWALLSDTTLQRGYPFINAQYLRFWVLTGTNRGT